MPSTCLRALILIAACAALTAAVPDHGMAGTCLAPHFGSLRDGFRYGFPPHIELQGLKFAGSNVPTSRPDVRDRILKEINYLLLDRRSRLITWLILADTLRPVINPILKNYDLPPEFIYLAAIESNYNPRALSSAGAFGYWQFIRSTALCGPNGCPELDWSMSISPVKDERADLLKSTHAAARYLAWMHRVKRVSLDEKDSKDGFNDWLLVAASYNAGPARVMQRLNSFGATGYWDVPLPVETERYVPRWIALGLISRHRDFYGVQVPARARLSFDTVTNVKLNKDLTLAAMARILKTTPRAVWELNAQIPQEKALFPAKVGRKAVEHTIHVPKGTSKQFLAQLAAHGYTKK